MRKSVLLSIFLVVTMGLVVVFAQQEKPADKDKLDEAIVQGEFAILYVKALRIPTPPGGWTPQSAANQLTSLGIEPKEGWKLDEILTEAVMIDLVKYIGIPLFTHKPDKAVTRALANYVFLRFEKFFRVFQPFIDTTSGKTATYIYQEGNPIPVGPVSPAEP
ncbi:MAG: hypothetical protein A2Y62_10220 [Candidatus Fischerbacteria bacterium RBG_13_37_8]|uniref:SLH domain-containing protein n=1 Tax=Candidatus Fischerbacteria bacterium RBG_13_37_8 TaxID=1817863 RepID=A0A1F5V7E4_9BACT|nr:MAG: hypothetical protein A2Y62_10220 [Candidatus Fischerbacteria bacterium RBG_13_37_8]